MFCYRFGCHINMSYTFKRPQETHFCCNALTICNAGNFLFTCSRFFVAVPCVNETYVSISTGKCYFHFRIGFYPFAVLLLIFNQLYIIKHFMFRAINYLFSFYSILFWNK